MNAPTLTFDYRKHTTTYKGYSIQTYEFGEGENIVFSFPSFPHSGLYYLWFLTHYDKHSVRFITFDLPGWSGYSENIFQKNDFTIDEYVEIAKVILSDYGVDKFSVIGYSFGGAMALKLAADCKERVNKLVLVSSVINSNIVQRFNLIRLVKLLHFSKYYNVLRNVIVRKMKEISRVLNEEEGIPMIFLEMYSDMVKHIDARVISESIYKLFTSDYSKYLDEIRDKEVLIVNTKEEPKLFRIQAEFLRRKLNNEKSMYIHGSHDDFILRCRKDVVKEVIKFLSK